MTKRAPLVHIVDDDPAIRQRLATYWTKIQIIRVNGLRTLSAAVSGRKDPSIAALGATVVIDLSGAELHAALAGHVDGDHRQRAQPGEDRRVVHVGAVHQRTFAGALTVGAATATVEELGP